MADQAVSEMISAFAAGCMDKENFVHFNNYIRHKGELPYKELGKLQIITSMLPVILEQEEPDPELKNRVAKRLISMQDEIKEKIKLEKQKTLEITRAKTMVEPPVPEPAAEIKKQEPKAVYADAIRNINPFIRKNETPQNDYLSMENNLFSEQVEQPVEIPSQTPLWIAIAVLFFIIVIAGYFSFTSIADLKDTITKTENNLAAAKSEWRSTNEFISKNVALIEFFNHDNVWVVQMSGIEPLMKITGKLFISMGDKEALLQITNLPTPYPESTYQLWLVTKSQTYSMGYFFVEPGSRYIKLINIPVIAKDQILEFKITLEPRSGSIVPTGQVYASGTLDDAVKRPSRR